jgi:hypothetical protein
MYAAVQLTRSSIHRLQYEKDFRFKTPRHIAKLEYAVGISVLANVLSRVCVIISGVWIGNRIYWQLTDRNASHGSRAV